MTSRSKRITLRVSMIALQWLGLTIGLGSLVMRSDTSFDELISPHLGAMPLFLAAILAGLMLGATIESPKIAVPLAILMCFGAASFVGVLSYAPVADDLLVRTTALDNYVARRVFLVTLIVSMAAVPATVVGNLLGSLLNPRHEIAPHPEDLAPDDEVPWWEQRERAESRKHPV